MLTSTEARALLTPAAVRTLRTVAGRKDAFTPDALVEAGVPGTLVRVLLVRDDAPPMRARVGLRRRTRVETHTYVWGPDVAGLLKGWE